MTQSVSGGRLYLFCALCASETAKAVRPIGGSRAGFACAPRRRPPRLGCRPSSRRLRRHYGVGRIDVLVSYVMVVIHDALALTPGTCGKNTGAHRHASHKARDVVRRAAKEPLAGCGKNADGWSFRGAGFAREPGIHEHGLMKSMVWPVFSDSGPGPKGRPGMTAKFFRALLRALWPKGSSAPRRTTSRAL